MKRKLLYNPDDFEWFLDLFDEGTEERQAVFLKKAHKRILDADTPIEVAQKILHADSPVEVAQKVLHADSPEEAALKLIQSEGQAKRLLALLQQKKLTHP